MRFAPSRREYSEWQCRWTKDILGRIATATRCCQKTRPAKTCVEVTENKRVKWIRRARAPLAVVVLAIVAYLVSRPPAATCCGRGGRRERSSRGASRSPSSSPISHARPALRAKLELVLAARAFAHDSLELRQARASRPTASSTATRSCSCSRARIATSCGRAPGGFPSSGACRTRATSTSTRRGPRSATSPRSGFDARSARLGVQHPWLVQRSAAPTTLARRLADRGNTVFTSSPTTRSTRPAGPSSTRLRQLRRSARSGAILPRARAAGSGAGVAARWEDEKIIGRFWASLYARVDSAFAARAGRRPDTVAAAHRRARLASTRDAREQMRRRDGAAAPDDESGALERIRLDNAVLMARRVYLTDLDAFDAVLARRRRGSAPAVAAIIEAAKSGQEASFDAVRRSRDRSSGAPPDTARSELRRVTCRIDRA